MKRDWGEFYKTTQRKIASARQGCEGALAMTILERAHNDSFFLWKIAPLIELKTVLSYTQMLKINKEDFCGRRSC